MTNQKEKPAGGDSSRAPNLFSGCNEYITEDGYTQIPHSLLEKAAKSSLSACALKILLILIRATAGWHKKECQLGFDKLKKRCAHSRRQIIRAVQILETDGWIKASREPYKDTHYSIVDCTVSSDMGVTSVTGVTSDMNDALNPKSSDMDVTSTSDTGVTLSIKDSFKDSKDRKRTRVKKPRASRATSVPSSFVVTEELKIWATKHVPSLNLESETERFLDYYRAKGTSFKDWSAAWRNWMCKSREYQSDRKPAAVKGDKIYVPKQ